MTTPKYLRDTLRFAAGLSELPDDLEAIHARELSRLRMVLGERNVVGIGISDKIVSGEPAGPLALTFYVRRKKPRAQVRGEAMVPPVVPAATGRAIFTDVFEIGDVRPQVSARRTPIQSGYSVGHRAGGPGTLGAIVRRGDKIMVLSNAHVLAPPRRAARGDPLFFPSPADGGADPADCFATVADFVQLRPGGDFVNQVDAALGEVLPGRLAEVLTAIPGGVNPVVLGVPRRGMEVALHGRSSGPSQSVVKDVDAAIQLPYLGLGLVGFRRQVLCEPYTQSGDSGALVIDQATGAVVGLHFAASTLGSYFTPIHSVISALKFSL